MSGDLWAGAEVQVFQLCCALSSFSGIEVSAITFNTGILEERLRKASIPVSVVDETRLSALSMTVAIARLLRQEQPDIVHTHGQKENILGSLGAMAAKIPHCVRTVHGNNETSLSLKRPHKLLLNAIDKLAGRFAQEGIVAVSEQLYVKLHAEFPRKAYKINNFVDVDRIRAEYSEYRPVKETSSLHIGLVGRLVPVKRADLFIAAMDKLRREHGLNFRASIIGDGPLRSQLQKQAQQLELGDSIDFVGFLDPVYPALASLDLLVMTSDHEGLPMVVLEALALEVPIVAHAVGGLPDALAYGAAGCLVSDHSANGYAKAIAEVVTSGNIDAKRNDALAHVRAEFGKQINSERYLSFYHSLSPQ